MLEHSFKIRMVLPEAYKSSGHTIMLLLQKGAYYLVRRANLGGALSEEARYTLRSYLHLHYCHHFDFHPLNSHQ